MTHGRLKSDGKKERVVGLCTYEWQKGQRVTRKIGVICDREREREMIPNRFDLLWSQFSLCFIYLTGITSTLTTRPPPQPPPSQRSYISKWSFKVREKCERSKREREEQSKRMWECVRERTKIYKNILTKEFIFKWGRTKKI